ncbi:MAG: hypothetical protein JST04_16980 [Bdellovibrionales bacterium]|nr:hypothetical protein [Bdellovibrionales bacterium]
MLLLCALLFLGFFHPRWGFFETNRFFWSVDDGCYLKRLFDFLGFALDRPGVCETTENYFPIGAPIAWLPAALLGRASYAVASAASVTEWTIAWIMIEAFAAWTASILFLERFLELAAPRIPPVRRAFLAVGAGIASSAFFYAANRQVLAHPMEWFFAAALVLSLKERRPLNALAAAGLLCLTRYNDLPALLMVAGTFVDSRSDRIFTRNHRLAFGVLLALCLAYVGWVAFGHGYGGVRLPELLAGLAWSDFGRFLWGADWGVAFTAPWFLAVAVIGGVLFRELSWTARGAFAWILLESALCIAWRGNGSMFAYRYLTGAYAAAVWIAMEAIVLRPGLARANAILVAVSAVWTLVLGHLYQGMISLGIGMQIARDATGLERRISNLPFLSTAMEQWGNLEVHRASLAQASAFYVWLKSLVDPDSLAGTVLVEGPTLFLLTLAVAFALLVVGLTIARATRKN